MGSLFVNILHWHVYVYVEITSADCVYVYVHNIALASARKSNKDIVQFIC